MVKLVKLDGTSNYFIDSETEEIVKKYDPDNKNLNVVITMDDSKLMVGAENIKTIFGGQIIVQYNNDRFIIDDGYRNNLIKAGYIVYKDYDTKKETDIEKGIKLKETILADIKPKLNEFVNNFEVISNDDTGIVIKESCHEIRICIDTVDTIVQKNILRKDNSLLFYPFDKNIDRFGALYLSIFDQRIDEEGKSDNDYNARIFSDTITKKLITKLGNDYHFLPQFVKSGILYQSGI